MGSGPKGGEEPVPKKRLRNWFPDANPADQARRERSQPSSETRSSSAGMEHEEELAQRNRQGRYATNVSYSLNPRAAFWSFLASG